MQPALCVSAHAPAACPAPTQMNLASTYNPELPRIRTMLEEAREAHWKLTAPKGFAALKVDRWCWR